MAVGSGNNFFCAGKIAFWLKKTIENKNGSNILARQLLQLLDLCTYTMVFKPGNGNGTHPSLFRTFHDNSHAATFSLVIIIWH